MNDRSTRLPHQTSPNGRPLMRMQWRDLLFMHWPVEASVLRPLIPLSLEIDEFDGSAWIGLIPFTMRDVLPNASPRWARLGDVRTLSAFHECNVRTYVHPKARPESPGVWFFSLDAASRPAVWAARRFFHLPYHFSRMKLDRMGDVRKYAVDRIGLPRAGMRCEWRVGQPLPRSSQGDLTHFLTERYALYSKCPAGRMHCGRIWHEPWSLRAAELISLEDGLLHAAGIEIDQSNPPLLHHADVLDMHAWRLETLTQ